MNAYVVIMYRWGDPTDDTYISGAFSDRVIAQLAGKLELINRGNKYEPTIKEIKIKKRRTITIQDITNQDEQPIQVSNLEKEYTIENGLLDEDYLKMHEYLSLFNNEELAQLRTWYSTYVNRI